MELPVCKKIPTRYIRTRRWVGTTGIQDKCVFDLLNIPVHGMGVNLNLCFNSVCALHVLIQAILKTTTFLFYLGKIGVQSWYKILHWNGFTH